MHQKILLIIFLKITFYLVNCSEGPNIKIWYGETQHFGKNGTPQKWVNVLGRITTPVGAAMLEYSLNGGETKILSLGPDRRRLANLGDFNVEMDYRDLKVGENILILTASDSNGQQSFATVKIIKHQTEGCPLPFTINWSEVNHIQEVAQIVDGFWELTPEGVRILEPYYDRVIGFGDSSWIDYEVITKVTFHGMRMPVKGFDGGAGVIHAAIALRWPGHDDDSNQPRVKWYPLGATAEFRLKPDLQNCSWRILGGGRKVVEEERTRTIQYNFPYFMKHQVKTVADSSTQYSVKFWPADQPEPADWDVQALEGPDDVRRGGALIIAHYTEVTFGNIQVNPITSSSSKIPIPKNKLAEQY
jgi:hypothetical protein